MVAFTTQPQPPVPTIEKSQLHSYRDFNRKKHYSIEILFIEVEHGRKYVKINLTNQIIDGDFPYIYQDRFQGLMQKEYIRIRNTSPLWEILRKMLISDGYLSKYNKDAILITAKELRLYLKGRQFKVLGEHLHGYKNVIPINSGDAE